MKTKGNARAMSSLAILLHVAPPEAPEEPKLGFTMLGLGSRIQKIRSS